MELPTAADAARLSKLGLAGDDGTAEGVDLVEEGNDGAPATSEEGASDILMMLGTMILDVGVLESSISS